MIRSRANRKPPGVSALNKTFCTLKFEPHTATIASAAQSASLEWSGGPWSASGEEGIGFVSRESGFTASPRSVAKAGWQRGVTQGAPGLALARHRLK